MDKICRFFIHTWCKCTNKTYKTSCCMTLLFMQWYDCFIRLHLVIYMFRIRCYCGTTISLYTLSISIFHFSLFFLESFLCGCDSFGSLKEGTLKQLRTSNGKSWICSLLLSSFILHVWKPNSRNGEKSRASFTFLPKNGRQLEK